jgi:hypothetical protein
MSQGIVNKNTIKKGKMELDSNQSEILPSHYGCDILLERIELEDTKDKTFPLDAYLVWYVSEGKEYLDLCRASKQVNIFDMYYDKYGSGALQKIKYGYGTISPRSWGYKIPEKKRKR